MPDELDIQISQTPESELLEIPELPSLEELDALEDLQSAGSTSFDQLPEGFDTQTPVQKGKPGENTECNICGRNVRVRKDGTLGVHKCEPKAQRGNRLETLPDRRSPMKSRTRDFCVGVISWGVEESAAWAIARPFDADSDDVPTELPDADVMIGVPLDIVWPEIPKGAQAFIDKLAENADVIDCGIAWFDWMRTIGKWSRDQRKTQRQLMEANGYGASRTTGTHLSTVPAFVPQEG
jgi:hypothetical protein